jgi:hypothetical protein
VFILLLSDVALFAYNLRLHKLRETTGKMNTTSIYQERQIAAGGHRVATAIWARSDSIIF